MSTEPDICAICQYPLEDEKATALPCKHRFHGQCLVDHLWSQTTGSCPLCRATNDANSGSESDNESENMVGTDSEWEHISLHDAIKTARKCAKNHPPTKRSLGTIKKWKLAATHARREARQLQKDLEEKEDVVFHNIQKYEDKQWTQFNTKFKKHIDELKDAKVKRCKAKQYLRATRNRLAAKYGYTH